MPSACPSPPLVNSHGVVCVFADPPRPIGNPQRNGGVRSLEETKGPPAGDRQRRGYVAPQPHKPDGTGVQELPCFAFGSTMDMTRSTLGGLRSAALARVHKLIVHDCGRVRVCCVDQKHLHLGSPDARVLVLERDWSGQGFHVWFLGKWWTSSPKLGWCACQKTRKTRTSHCFGSEGLAGSEVALLVGCRRRYTFDAHDPVAQSALMVP